MAESIVDLTFTYYFDPDRGRPLFFASVFIGEPNLDPEILANRKTVKLQQQDGSTVEILPSAQPLTTGAGGGILYNGSLVTVLTDGNYSLKVLDNGGDQRIFINDAFSGVPVVSGDVYLKSDNVDDMINNSEFNSGDYVQTPGYSIEGDRGNNLYLAEDVTADPDDGGSLIKSIANPLIQFRALFPDGEYRAEQWSASDTNPDSAPAINAAIVYVGTRPSPIPGGTVKIVSDSINLQTQVWIRYDYIFLDFSENTSINIDPSSDLNVIRVERENLTGVIFGGGILNPVFFSNDITFQKICINLIDSSGFVINGPRTHSPHVLGNNSTGIYIQGRELCSIRDLYMQCERVVLIGPIPPPHVPSGIGCDHFNFHNFYGVAGSSTPVVQILDNVPVTQMSWTGYQAWAGGTSGFFWEDTTGTIASNGVTFENVRFEQPADAIGYSYFVSHSSTTVQELNIKGGQSSNRNDIFARNVQYLSIKDHSFTSLSGTVLNVDSTVIQIEASNCLWQEGSVASIVDQTLVWGSPRFPRNAPLPTSFQYISSINDRDTIETNMSITSPQFGVINGSIAFLVKNSTAGSLFVTNSAGFSAVFDINAENDNATKVIDAISQYSDIVNNPNTTNIYYSVVNSRYEIQNLTGADLFYKIMVIGSSEAF